EKQYENLLHGETGEIITLRDALGRPIFLKNDAATEAREGYRLHLTLDAKLQFLAEKFLHETIDEYQATEGTVIMMDPSSGAIRVMASYPNFNANVLNKSTPAARRN